MIAGCQYRFTSSAADVLTMFNAVATNIDWQLVLLVLNTVHGVVIGNI